MTVKFLQPIKSLLCQAVEPILRLAKNKSKNEWPKTRRLSVPEEKKKKKKKTSLGSHALSPPNRHALSPPNRLGGTISTPFFCSTAEDGQIITHGQQGRRTKHGAGELVFTIAVSTAHTSVHNFERAGIYLVDSTRVASSCHHLTPLQKKNPIPVSASHFVKTRPASLDQ
jgi:hypothetical protein